MKNMTHLSRFVFSINSVRPFASTLKTGFPKHKELFTDEYFQAGNEDIENPFAKESKQGDYELPDESVKRMSNTGVLNTYKKQLGLTA
jgi:hypothetical protein